MKNNKTLFPYYLAAAVVLVAGIVSCNKFLPTDRENISGEATFVQKVFEPTLGRNTVFSGAFSNPNNGTSYPVKFKMVNPRRYNGDPAPELTDVFPVTVWKSPYTGEEASIAEIEAKRSIEYHNIFEIKEHSGDFVMWAAGSSSFIRAQPDSGYVFDVELSNSGGRRYFRGLRLLPFRERPFEPSNYNPITGQSTSNGVYPSMMANIKGDSTNEYLNGGDVDVYIRKPEIENPQGNTLTFRFLDKHFKPMNPDKFALTDWANLLHGFNMKKTATEVTYTVAYPIPLVDIPTAFTTGDGRRATVKFSYTRLGYGGLRETAVLGLNFAIYEKGDWEIVFAFKNDNPKFIND